MRWTLRRHLTTWGGLAGAVVAIAGAWQVIVNFNPLATKVDVTARFETSEQVRVVDRIDLLKFEVSMLRLKGALASLSDEERDDIQAKIQERTDLECLMRHGIGCGLRHP